MDWGVVSKKKFELIRQFASAVTVENQKLAVENQKLKAALQDANEHAAELTEELTGARSDHAAVARELIAAQNDARHFETEFIRMEMRFKHAEERADFWKAEAELRPSTVTVQSPFTPAAANEADEEPAQRTVPPPGFWARFNEIHNDGWRPPDPDAVTAEKEPLSGDE